MVWLPLTFVRLSDHWKVLPTCGISPSKLLPIPKPPEMLTKGTPSRFAPRFGVIPSLGFVGSLKHWSEGTVAHESCTRFVCCGCRKLRCASRKYVKRNSFTR